MGIFMSGTHPRTFQGKRAARLYGRPAFVAFLTLLLCSAGMARASNPVGEYDVKAAFIYNFAKFITWKNNAPSLVVCVLGDDPFGPALDSLAGKTIDNKTVKVRRIALPQDAATCQMLFVAGSEASQLGPIVAQVRSAPLLTIGDTPGFAQRGVMLNFYVDANKVHFEANIDAIQRGSINVSSQLLKLARITHDGGSASD
jgi:hypothetical protein